METINDLFGPIAANDNKRTCPECGGDVSGHATKVYCCKACRVRAKTRRNGPRYDALRYERAPIKQCLNCGRDFKAVNKGNEPLFCSKSCSLGSRTRAKVLKELVAAILDGTKPSAVRYVVHKKRCVICDGWHTRRGTVCSDECRLSANRKREKEKNAAAHALIDRVCNECGKTFAPEYGNKHRDYCSHECMRKHGKRVGKASRAKRIRSGVSEPVSHTRVFEAAGWMCVVCGVDTPRELRGSNDNNAPELDHVVPLARGGSHTYDNVQCLCRKCNGSKSDMLMDEWMASPPPPFESLGL